MARHLIIAAATVLLLSPATRAQPPAEPDQACTTEVAAAPRWWARGEYVFWTIGTGKIVEILDQAINSDLFNALLDASGKDYGDVARTILGSDRTGFRVNLGAWLDDSATVGVEAGFLYVDRGPLVLPLGRRDLSPLERLIPNGSVTVDPINGSRIDRPLLALLLLRRLGLPAIDSGGRPIVIPYGNRNLANGSVNFDVAEQTFWALDLLGRCRLFDDGCLRVDGLVGYRRVSYQDTATVRSEVDTLARPLLPGTRLSSIDLIQTENTYDGALLGVEVEMTRGCWEFAVRPTITIAMYQSVVDRIGATTVTLPDLRRLAFPGGTYLRSADLGTFSASGWTVIPEIALRATRACGENVRLTFGTSLLYLPEAARALPQLDIGLDPDRTLPGSIGTRQTRTIIPPDLRSVFLATVSVGVEVRY